MPPTYVAHPANMDAEEAFSILFVGPKDGPVYNYPMTGVGDGTAATDYFTEDARRTARLIVWLSTPTWSKAFCDEMREAINDLMKADSDDSLVDFVGGPVEQISEQAMSADIELAG